MKTPKGIPASVLKLVAVVTMTIDHAAIAISNFNVSMGLNDPATLKIMRWIGRLAFPIFVFLLVEGFFKTGDRRKYAIRLAVFAVISEIPFNLIINGTILYTGKQSVMVTLLIGYLAMWLTEKYKDSLTIRMLVFAAAVALGWLLKVDYSYFGTGIILVMYYCRESRLELITCSAVCFIWEPAAILAFPLIYLYNGERGRQIKYFFYAYYPAHLMILYLAAKYWSTLI